MENALFVEYREDRKISYKSESTIHSHQRRAKCSYEEAIDHEGYALYARIAGKLFHSCNLYILQEGNTFHKGYIEIVFQPMFHSLNGSHEPIPIRQFIYVQDFFLWIEAVNLLVAAPGSSIHPVSLNSMSD